MKLYTQFVFYLFLCWLNRVGSSSQKTLEKQRFAIEPVDSNARLGDTITLPCRVVNRVGGLQWTRDGFGLGLERTLSGFPRYQMVGSEEEGDYSLEISNVQLEDDAMFQCQVGASTNIPGIRSRFAKLTVFVPPEPVKIKEGEFLDVLEGKQVTLNCESNGGKPSAELTWLEENGHPIKEGVELSKQDLPDGKRFNSLAKLSFIAGKQHHNKRYICRAENSALEEPQNTSIMVRVRYSPKVKLTYNGDQTSIEPLVIQESHDDLKEINESTKENEELNENIVIFVGENVTIKCDALANPDNNLIYKWYKNEQIFPGDYSGNFLNLPSVNSDLNGVKIGCEVINNIGTSGVIYRTLSVSFAPKFIKSLNKTNTVLKGSNFKLTCEVRSNPPADILWQFENNQIIGKGKNLLLNNMDYSKAGRYTCLVNVKGFSEIQSSTIISIKGSPRVISPTNQYGLEGEPIKLECVVQSVPKVATVVWRRNNQLIDVDNKNGYELITEPLPDTDSMVRHLLVIRNSKFIDFGQYNCTATNELGEDSILITLTRQKTFPSFIVSTIVVATTVAFIFIGIVALVFTRKSSKTGDDFTANLKKQSASKATNSNMVLTSSNNTGNNSNYNKALTDSGRSHLALDNGSSAANSDLKLEIRTSSSLSDQEHHNAAINWDEEFLMNNTILAANGLYTSQHVAAYDTTNNPINNVYNSQYNQRFIITNGVAPNYVESIYNYPTSAQLVANTQIPNASIALNMNSNQAVGSQVNPINNNIISSKYSPTKHTLSSPSPPPPTYHNLPNTTATNNLYLPSYNDYGQLIDYMQVNPGQVNQTTTDGLSTNDTSALIGYAITSNGQQLMNLSKVPNNHTENSYGTLQPDSRYKTNNYSTRADYSNNHAISVNATGLPATALYSNNSITPAIGTQNSAINVPNNTNLRNFIKKNQINSSLGSVNSQTTLATHV